MRKLEPSRDALSFLMALPGKQFKQIVGTVFGLLKNPEPHDSIQLAGYTCRRVDIGEYRVVYEVTDDTVEILVIGKRNDDEVYKQLKRKIPK